MGRMGRYAFFNTGFEYKFRFGIQMSDSIQMFGGLGNIYGSRQSAHPYHEWVTDDLPCIEKKLRDITCSLNQELLDIPSYEATIEGTYHVFQALTSLYHIHPNEKMVAQYILGACIYHQLLYKSKLTVEYEI